MTKQIDQFWQLNATNSWKNLYFTDYKSRYSTEKASTEEIFEKYFVYINLLDNIKSNYKYGRKLDGKSKVRVEKKSKDINSRTIRTLLKKRKAKIFPESETKQLKRKETQSLNLIETDFKFFWRFSDFNFTPTQMQKKIN